MDSRLAVFARVRKLKRRLRKQCVKPKNLPRPLSFQHQNLLTPDGPVSSSSTCSDGSGIALYDRTGKSVLTPKLFIFAMAVSMRGQSRVSSSIPIMARTLYAASITGTIKFDAMTADAW